MVNFIATNVWVFFDGYWSEDKKNRHVILKKNDKVYIFGNFQQNRCLRVLQELKRLQRMVLNFVMETCILATKKKKKNVNKQQINIKIYCH